MHDHVMADPELSANCEAAGLELVVRAWWRGARSGCGPKETAWLRKTASGGVMGGAHDRLLRCGIPERVLHSGVELGHVLAQDKGVTKNWHDVVAKMQFSDRKMPESARCARSPKLLFREKLMEEVNDHFNIRMPSIPGASVQLTPRRMVPSPRTPISREDGEVEKLPPARTTDSANVSRPGSSPTKVRAWQESTTIYRQDSKGIRTKLPLFPESPKDTETRPMKVRPKLDPEALQSRKELAHRLLQDGETSKVKETPSNPSSPKARNFAEIFQSTASKMLESQSNWSSSEPFSPVSPTPASPWWDSKRERSAGTPRLRQNGTSKFDEWAKRKVEQRVEEEKEEEGSRKQKEREIEAADSLKNSLLSDKAVASELVAKKAVTDLNSIRRIFMAFDSDGSGLIEPPEFMPLLSKLLRRRPEDLDKREVWAVWDEVDADGSGSIDFDEFQSWYAKLMGIDILDYGENFIPDEISSDQILVRSVAKSLNRSILEVEKLYDEFKKLDTDGSNTLEMHEFRQLIQKEFAPKGPEVPEHVFKMFWKDFDKDGRGSVSFTDFCKWYLKFMKGEASPMEQYFAYMSAPLAR